MKHNANLFDRRTMDIGFALKNVKRGMDVRRGSWPVGQYIRYEEKELYLYMRGPKYWNPTQEDVLAWDWEVR
jgi:hypothetical protein